MPTDPKAGFSAGLLQEALARWEGEGGALSRDRWQMEDVGQESLLPLSDAELVQLRIRVIALENRLIAVLANAPNEQLRAAREMAGYIAPRPGFTQHKLTLHAENHMLSLVERAMRFSIGSSPT